MKGYVSMSATVGAVFKKWGDSQALLCPCFFLALSRSMESHQWKCIFL